MLPVYIVGDKRWVSGGGGGLYCVCLCVCVCVGSNLTTIQLDNQTTWQFDNLENFTGSQRLSDFQTFLAGNQLYEL